jgi:Na+-transporting methylmalonyl-CoA/oxaloacetate decarboxylase gamma subunit
MNLQALLETVPITIYGMGGIFIVMIIVYLGIKILTRFFEK